jgi:DNA-binding beta-propeller fold protein YncE
LKEEWMNAKLCFAVTYAALLAARAAEPAALRVVQTIPLPGVEGRLDHLAVDLDGHRLFIAALGNNSVEVVDLKAGKRARSVTGFHEPQGLAWIPERNALFVASGEDDSCHVLDGKSFVATAVAGKIEDADNARYDARAHRVYVGCGKGALRVIDVKDWTVAGEVVLSAHPEAFQLDARIFVNVPEKRSIEVIDRVRMQAVASWPLPNAAGNFPMAVDGAHHRLFVGCRKPSALIVLDSDTGKEIASVAIDGDADDVFYDAKSGRVYVTCGAGFIDVLDENDLLPYNVTDKIPTAEGARTSLFVPELNRLYLAVPHRGSQQAEVRVFEAASQ